MLHRRSTSWDLTVPSPAREVFAVMEQMIGTMPYRFESVGAASARIVEVRRKNLVGAWRTPRRRRRQVTCTVVTSSKGQVVHVEARGGAAPISRARELVEVLSRGAFDQRTIYRERRLPPGPVTLVASWAGMPYPLYMEPRPDAPRGPAITTATPLEAVDGSSGSFCRVRLGDGTEGYVETDQIVAAPEPATRAAQLDAARFV